jgi:hypothetical protein
MQLLLPIQQTLKILRQIIENKNIEYFFTKHLNTSQLYDEITGST